MREADERLIQALRSLFRPIANVLIKNGISAGLVVDQLKVAFVEAARDNHGMRGEPASVNRISNVTGMSRKYISTLLERPRIPRSTEKNSIPIEAEVLGAWLSRDDYLDQYGLPKPLELEAGPCSFQSLVEDIVGSQRRDEAIESLIRAGTVSMRDDGFVEMASRCFPIRQDLPQILNIGPSALASTIDKNWARPNDERFGQRVAHTSRVDSQKLLVVRRVAKERISHFVEEIDDILCNYDRDDDAPILDPDGNELSMIGVGVYYFEIDK